MPAAMQKVAIETPRNARLPEERHVEHGPVLTHLDSDEDDEQQHPTDERDEDHGARPAAGVAAKDSEDDQEQRRCKCHETAHVRVLRALVPRLRNTSERDRECEHPDRDIDEEDPAPAEAVGEDATDEGAAGNGGAYRGAPDRKRSEAVWPAVLVTDQSQRRCEQRGAADPLERTRHVETS